MLEWLLDINDLRKLTEGKDWRFGLVADYNDYVILGLVLALAGMVYLTVRSYRREGDAPRPAKAILASIRILVLLLLFLCVFRPAIVLRFVNTLHSSVVVMVDDSLSMSFTDRYASPEAADYRDALAGKLAVEPAELETLSRSAMLRKALAGEDSPLVRLSKDHPLLFMAFGTDRPGEQEYARLLGVIDAVQDDPAAAPDPNVPAQIAGLLAQLKGTGYETNPPAALRAALDRTQGRRVEGVVFVSDGQITAPGASDRLESALRYASERGAVYPVLVGDPQPIRNVAVTSLDAPREVRRGTKTEFTAWLSARNCANLPLTVRLERRDPQTGTWAPAGTEESITIEPPAPGAVPAPVVRPVTLEHEPPETGQFTYRAVVDPLPDEQTPADNAAEALVSVADQKIRILFITGSSGWEYQYLRDYLLRQPELYRVSIWQQTADKDINQPASEGMRLARLGFDDDPGRERLLPFLLGVPGDEKRPGYDVVILYDPQHTAGGFDKKFIDEALYPFVFEHGGGLCYMAGGKYSELNLQGRNDVFGRLRDMLPVTLGTNTMTMLDRIDAGDEADAPDPIRLTADGIDHPITRLTDNAEEALRVWDILPGIFWSHSVVSVKPAARVLAESSNPTYRTAENQARPLIVVQPFGNGARVLYVGFHATWRWRYVSDSLYHRRFWANVLQYLATLKARRVIITTGGDRFDAGSDIDVQASVYREDFLPLDEPTFTVEMVNVETGEAQELELQAVEGKPGRYRKVLGAADKGAYELTALREYANRDDLVSSKRITIEVPRGEALRPEADEMVLRAMARPRTEHFLRLSEVERLGELIPPGRRTSVDELSRELWDSKLTLLLIVLLLGTEWILRKRYNMA